MRCLWCSLVRTRVRLCVTAPERAYALAYARGCVHAYIRACVCVSVRACVRARACACARAYILSYIDVCIYIYIYACVAVNDLHDLYDIICICICARTRAQNKLLLPHARRQVERRGLRLAAREVDNVKGGPRHHPLHEPRGRRPVRDLGQRRAAHPAVRGSEWRSDDLHMFS